MKRNAVRINEQQLRKMIAGSINKVLKESFGSLMGPDAPGPSQEEEEFENELYNLIDQYKGHFLSHGYKRDDFYKWCCEIVDKAIGQNNYSDDILSEEIEASPEMKEKAMELVYKVDDWSVEEITDRVSYHCGEGIIYGEVQDENGEWWSFRAGGVIDDGEVVEVQYDCDIEFEAPDGTKGYI